MTGLALGGYRIGRTIERRRRLLRLFGLLELGIGGSAILFAALMQVYQPVYVKLAQVAPESPLYLTLVRILFAVVALIIPTTLMGGTLPVLTTFTSRLLKGAGIRLSFLYGCNTLGAVCGAAATGFVMLRSFSMGKTLATAITLNLLIGVTALAPRSIGNEFLRGDNLADLLGHREPILPYLRKPPTAAGQAVQVDRWQANHRAAQLDDRAHVLEVQGKQMTYEFADLARELEDRYPRYAPWRFVRDEADGGRGGRPQLLRSFDVTLLDEEGTPYRSQIAAILVRSNNGRSRLFFVDDASRTVFGKMRIRKGSDEG